MTENTEDKNRAAEERSQDTRRLVRQVRSATCRKYTPEEKIHIVLQGFRREVTANELCRREGIKPANFYSWTKEFKVVFLDRSTVCQQTAERGVCRGALPLCRICEGVLHIHFLHLLPRKWVAERVLPQAARKHRKVTSCRYV